MEEKELLILQAKATKYDKIQNEIALFMEMSDEECDLIMIGEWIINYLGYHDGE